MSRVTQQQMVLVLLFAVLFLFLFQLLAEFVEAVYAFGLLSTSVPPQIVAVLLLLSPAALLPVRREPPTWLLHAALAIVLLARLAVPALGTGERMVTAGVGTAAWFILFPLLLARHGQSEERDIPAALAAGLMVAVGTSALLRTAGSGLDLSTVGWGQVVGWGLAVIALFLWLTALPAQDVTTRTGPRAGVVAPALGVMSVFILLYFTFTAPHVLARWTGVDYRWVVLLYALGLGGAAVVLVQRRAPSPPPSLILALNLVFVFALALTARGHQFPFPPQPEAYPLPEPPITWAHRVPLALTLLLFPLLFVDFAWFVARVVRGRPSPRALGAGFALASLYLLILIFAHVFTTVYDYIPVVGPFFRDRFWQVHLVVGLVLLAALAGSRPEGAAEKEVGSWHRGVALLNALLALGSVLTAWLVSARPVPPSTAAEQVTVLTYNIQQGYSEAGRRNFDGQLALIRRLKPDIIGLQETDNARIAGGNADVVRYFTNALNMYAYYGPKTPTGTFGIALLSRYPIRHPRTWFLYSEGEQVAVIEAEVTVGEQEFRVFVTHLGNGGPMVQQRQFVQLVERSQRVIAMGDYNFRPDTPQYRLTTELLVDTWPAVWPSWADAQGIRPVDKIDHIFISPDLRAVDARYVASPASDHPAVTATISVSP